MGVTDPPEGPKRKSNAELAPRASAVELGGLGWEETGVEVVDLFGAPFEELEEVFDMVREGGKVGKEREEEEERGARD